MPRPYSHKGIDDKAKRPKEKFSAAEFVKGRGKKVQDSLDKEFGANGEPAYHPWYDWSTW